MLPKTSNEPTIRCIVVCGPATCGKTTLAKAVEKQTGCNRIEGDDYHSEKWKRKPYPLSDEERDRWIAKLTRAICQSLAEHRMTVATCSALTRRVQSQLMAIRGVVLVYLDISLATALMRASARAANQDHWFHEEYLIRDQFKRLQLPVAGHQVVIHSGDKEPEKLVTTVLSFAKWKLLCPKCESAR
ncbi:AAA family ATPase [Rhodopirellula sp. JC639]|uniref:AAA family ATPase n=1 Tax=Stieleria mannarensis TaxID=2755585 RepID=UPI00160471C0|nr:AAA family ATPase [Rhodopirellula sp. JC639]